MNFKDAYSELNSFNVISRERWDINGETQYFIFKQVPTTIPIGIIQKMTSLPQSIKDILETWGKDFNYKNQIAVLNRSREISSFQFRVEDFEADDWYLAYQTETVPQTVPVIGKVFSRSNSQE